MDSFEYDSCYDDINIISQLFMETNNLFFNKIFLENLNNFFQIKLLKNYFNLKIEKNSLTKKQKKELIKKTSKENIYLSISKIPIEILFKYIK